MKNFDHDPASRRNALRAGAGLALIGAGAAATAQTTVGVAQTPARPLQDPRAEYAKPPFPKQQQERPGLASRMNPKPDHGEKSYRGSGRLAGRKAVALPGDIRNEAFCNQLVSSAVRE